MDQNFLNCQFCQNQFDINQRVPRMIFECGHSICSVCLNHYFQEHTPSIKCPQDNITISLLGKTEDIFPINQTVIGILKTYNNNSVEIQSQSPIRRKSDNISSRNEIFTSFGTNVQKFSQISADDLNRPSSIDNIKQCQQHQKELDTVCFKCQMVICMQCALFDQHKNHKVDKMENFREYGQSICQQLFDTKNNIQGQKDHTQNKYFEEVIKPLYKIKQNQVKKDIKKCYKIAIANLKRQEEEVQNKIDEIFDNFDSNFNQKFSNAFDDFKDDLDKWVNMINDLEETNKSKNSIDKLFSALNINNQYDLITKGNHLQKKMIELRQKYDDKANEYLENIKIEQKISYEEYFFDVIKSELHFESQLYNIDTDINPDLQNSNLFNEKLPEDNKDLLPDMANHQFLLNDKPIDQNETNFQEDNLFQDVNVSEVSELSLSKVQHQKAQTFNPNNIHNIMLKHRKTPQKMNFCKKVTEPISRVTESLSRTVQPPRLTNQSTLKNLNTLNKFDILSQHTGMNLMDNMNRKTNSNKRLLSGQENISKKTRSKSKNSRSTKVKRVKQFQNLKKIQQLIQTYHITVIQKDLTKEQLDKISIILLKTKKVKKIKLKGNNLKENAIQKLCKNIQNSHIEEIDFSFNSLTEQGIRHIQQLVEKNHFIKKINLKRNQLPLKSRDRISNELKQKGSKTLIVDI